MLAGGLVITGALLLEAVEAVYDSTIGGDEWPYILKVAAEEALEKAGIIILLSALLSYLGAIARDVHLQIAPD